MSQNKTRTRAHTVIQTHKRVHTHTPTHTHTRAHTLTDTLSPFKKINEELFILLWEIDVRAVCRFWANLLRFISSRYTRCMSACSSLVWQQTFYHGFRQQNKNAWTAIFSRYPLTRASQHTGCWTTTFDTNTLVLVIEFPAKRFLVQSYLCLAKSMYVRKKKVCVCVTTFARFSNPPVTDGNTHHDPQGGYTPSDVPCRGL